MTIGNRVQIYFNLHKKLYSVKDKKTQRVIDHVNEICLENVKFIVRQGGRNKVLETRQKNVHAFIEGDMVEELKTDLWTSQASYNPYKYDSFIDTETKEKLFSCDNVLMNLIGKKPVIFFK